MPRNSVMVGPLTKSVVGVTPVIVLVETVAQRRRATVEANLVSMMRGSLLLEVGNHFILCHNEGIQCHTTILLLFFRSIDPPHQWNLRGVEFLEHMNVGQSCQSDEHVWPELMFSLMKTDEHVWPECIENMNVGQ